MHIRTQTRLVVAALAVFAASCGSGEGNDGASSLIRWSDLAPGNECAAGGRLIQLGTDKNDNGFLDPEEVQTESPICNGQGGEGGAPGQNGAPGQGGTAGQPGPVGPVGPEGAQGTDGENGQNGKASLVRVSADTEACEGLGGTRVEVFIDEDGDGQIGEGDTQVGEPALICNGQNGQDGANGQNGENGQDGLPLIVRSGESFADANGTCAYGGQVLFMGYDRNGNGLLDLPGDEEDGQEVVDESVNTQFICNGAPGQDGESITGASALLEGTVVPAGDAICQTGGVKFSYGLDLDGNGLLEESEGESIDETYVCNGEIGADGQNGVSVGALVEDATTCGDAGGKTVTMYADADGSGAWEDGEQVLNAYTLCNGANGENGQNGFSPLITVWDICQAQGVQGDCYDGVTSCGIAGGKVISVVSEEGGEPTYSEVCNGQAGQNGADGQNGANGMDGRSVGVEVLDLCLVPTLGPTNCYQVETDVCGMAGGKAIVVFEDTDANGTQNDGETTVDVDFVCNGAAGQNGTDGQDGANGQDGQDGQNGDGSNGPAKNVGIRIEYTFELPETEVVCTQGYQTVFVGLTENTDGTLSESDTVTASFVTCAISDIDEDGHLNLSDDCPEYANPVLANADVNDNEKDDSCEPTLVVVTEDVEGCNGFDVTYSLDEGTWEQDGTSWRYVLTDSTTGKKLFLYGAADLASFTEVGTPELEPAWQFTTTGTSTVNTPAGVARDRGNYPVYVLLTHPKDADATEAELVTFKGYEVFDIQGFTQTGIETYPVVVNGPALELGGSSFYEGNPVRYNATTNPDPTQVTLDFASVLGIAIKPVDVEVENTTSPLALGSITVTYAPQCECQYGGERFYWGYDEDETGTLEESEIEFDDTTCVECGASELDCNGDYVDVCEIDSSSDDLNCGGCGIECAGDENCNAGTCEAVCAPNSTEPDFCAGDVCVDFSSDDNNCGSCGNVCGDGNYCDAGQCVPSCAAPEFQTIPTGSFVRNNGAQTVNISMFEMQATEVTQCQWQALMGNNPSLVDVGPMAPVETVSWYDAVAYMNALSESVSLMPCYDLSSCTGMPGTGTYTCTDVTFSGLSCDGYRLPTDAEWEYAARGGTTGDYYDSDLDAIAWYNVNSGSTKHPVKQKLPNAYGLYDMLGNVWEWTGDWYGTYPGDATLTDPLGPTTGSFRVLRGGYWFSLADFLVVSNRDYYSPGYRNGALGFRPSRSVAVVD